MKKDAGRKLEDMLAGEHALAVVELESPAFAPGRRIPVDFTADGAGRSPPLRWGELPSGTRALALLCDDPDAPRETPWVHWVIFNVPADWGGLPEGVSAVPLPLDVPGAVQGLNDFGKYGYGGPAPPRGHGTRRYRFRVYALDRPLRIPGQPIQRTLIQGMRGHVLGTGELVGTYRR